MFEFPPSRWGLMMYELVSFPSRSFRESAHSCHVPRSSCRRRAQKWEPPNLCRVKFTKNMITIGWFGGIPIWKEGAHWKLIWLVPTSTMQLLLYSQIVPTPGVVRSTQHLDEAPWKLQEISVGRSARGSRKVRSLRWQFVDSSGDQSRIIRCWMFYRATMIYYG